LALLRGAQYAVDHLPVHRIQSYLRALQVLSSHLHGLFDLDNTGWLPLVLSEKYAGVKPLQAVAKTVIHLSGHKHVFDNKPWRSGG
jgi:hypothetical protein